MAKFRLGNSLWSVVLVGLAILLAIIAFVLAITWWIGQIKYEDAAKPENVERTTEDVQDLTFSGDFNKARETVNSALSNPKLSDDAKHALYIQEATVYETEGNYDSALESYLKAESLKETSGVAQAIASIYVMMENKEKALEYYKKALELMPDKDSQASQSAKKYFENWIIYLEGGEPSYE